MFDRHAPAIGVAMCIVCILFTIWLIKSSEVMIP